MNRKLAVLCIAVFVSSPQLTVSAQILEGKSAPVLIKRIEPSAEALQLELTEDGETTLRRAYLISTPADGHPPGAGTFDGLPACASRHTRVEPLVKHELATEKLDLVVYQNGDSEQKRQARQVGSKTAPYVEGALLNPFRDSQDKMQGFLRALTLRCLPTRVRAVTRDKELKLEYREGEAALSSLGH